MSKIHIGKKIQEAVNNSSMTVVSFASKINLTRDGVYKLFKKDTINILQLQKIGEVLQHNFFDYYTPETLVHTKEKRTDYGFVTKDEFLESNLEIIKIIKSEINQLREELALKNDTGEIKVKVSKKTKSKH